MITSDQIEEAKQAYFDNADYLEMADVAKCKAFITACTRLIPFLPSRVHTGGNTGSEIDLSLDLVSAQHDVAVRWLRTNNPNGYLGQRNAVAPSPFFRGGGMVDSGLDTTQ